MGRNTLLALMAVCCAPLPAYADPSLTAGNWTIHAAAGQSVDVNTLAPIAVTAAGSSSLDAFAGVNLFLSVQAGGPTFEAVDLVGPGTIFSIDNIGQNDLLGFGQHDQCSTTAPSTAGVTVGPDGDLAFITFDATGVLPGTYSFSLSSSMCGPSSLPPFMPLPAGNLVDGTVTVVSAGVAALMATQTDALQNDVDGQGDFDPGDTLRYTVLIENVGGASAENAAFTSSPDPNAPLVDGSVSTSRGVITSGNGAMDTSVEVDIGTIPAAASATVTFDVMLVDPLPEGVTSVSSQGVVTASGLTDVLTNDPDTPTAGDATTTDVVSALETCQEEAMGCASGLDTCTSNLEACEGTLGTALENLATCLSDPPFEDTDADGEHDQTDACPATPPGEPVDHAGCSLEQFCTGIDISGPKPDSQCNRADWQNDEPLGAGDCKARGQLCEPR